MRPGSDWELGRLLFLHIYKWCIGNFLPSQHRGLCVWLHSCNALDRSRSSTVATRAAVHKDANCTKCCCCCHVLWLQCLGKHYFSATQISVQCKMCAVHTRVVQQCSAVQVSINVSGSSLLAHSLDQLFHRPKIASCRKIRSWY